MNQINQHTITMVGLGIVVPEKTSRAAASRRNNLPDQSEGTDEVMKKTNQIRNKVSQS